MAYSKKIIVDARRDLAFGGIGAAYVAVGGALASPARVFIINNLTDANLDISLDGVNDNFILPPRSFKLIDVTANKVRDDGWFAPEGTVFYVKQTVGAPTLGAFYVEIIRS